MGIDPGDKRVGIAISDENKIIATPYTTLIKNKYSDFVKELIDIVNENQIKGIIIGNPINMDGSSSQSSQSARDLAINLSKDVTENITMWDERLSSQGAFNLSNDLGSNTSKKVNKLDQNSAQFILQGALDYLTKENT
jgi:putative Holliday junction resolvase